MMLGWLDFMVKKSRCSGEDDSGKVLIVLVHEYEWKLLRANAANHNIADRIGNFWF